MNIIKYVIPTLIIALLIYAMIKKVKVFDCATRGAKNALTIIFELFPFFAAILIMTKLFEACGLFSVFTKLLSPILKFLQIPTEVINLIVLKPFSGSGSLAVLDNVIKTYGADSYISRCAAVIFGSSETVFFVASAYFSQCKTKKLLSGTIIALLATNISAVFACFLCRFL